MHFSVYTFSKRSGLSEPIHFQWSFHIRLQLSMHIPLTFTPDHAFFHISGLSIHFQWSFQAIHFQGLYSIHFQWSIHFNNHGQNSHIYKSHKHDRQLLYNIVGYGQLHRYVISCYSMMANWL